MFKFSKQLINNIKNKTFTITEPFRSMLCRSLSDMLSIVKNYACANQMIISIINN